MRTYTLAACTLAALAAIAGCSSSNTTATASKPTHSYAPDSAYAKCRAQQWPQTMPDVRGKTFDPLGEDLQCFENLEALAPDGHDVLDDYAPDVHEWTVTSSTPAPGAKVQLTTHITLKLRDPRP
ncbi:PASTA domain-containing protein [Streptomyces sp. NPDC002176]|uniref:PASTA domain-containing protein n=1 Tax=Streptomyces sp. NPDC002176 TaxID=3364634 RepID=UPI00384EE54B